MSGVTVSGVHLAGTPDRPLLVCGPSLGTSATALWSEAARLADKFHVIAWDLPGHGATPVTSTEFTVADLAAAVLELVDEVQSRRGDAGAGFVYAGDSVGGAVGLQLLLDAPGRVTSAVLLCTGAKIGEAQDWQERAQKVRASGTPVMLESSAQRWFAPGFLDRAPEEGSALLHSLSETDASGYAAVCDALAAFDVRDRLAEIRAPLLLIAGQHDTATPVASLSLVAHGVADSRLVVLHDVAHLAPAEAPDDVAWLIRAHSGVTTPVGDPLASGMEVRRAVLGDAHVDRATAAATDFTQDFQDFITQYAWGGIWTRPGLDRRSRSLITLSTLVARGHHEELALHLRAARTNGLTIEEIKELLLQTAIYCGVPDANTAFRIAQTVLAELDAEESPQT